jgi:hypothetical protein
MKNRHLIKFLALVTLTICSCTKLNEQDLLYGTVTSNNFYKTDLEFAAAVGAAYTNLYNIGGNNHMIPLNEVTTDEIVVPTRGADWGDGGHWVRLQTHTYTSQDPTPNNGWNFLYAGIATCNRVIYNLEPLGTAQSLAYIAELKALRAVYYYWLLDMFGGVPISTDFANTDPIPNSTRQQVYDFVESELTTNGPLLQKNGPGDGPNYGRINYWTCQAALAHLYLNAEVYTGTPHWDKAIAACNEIINAGLYSLAPNYKDNFSQTNQKSPEIIWAIPQDHVYAKGFNIPMMTLNPLNQNTYSMSAQPWNGFATIQEFYQSYIDPVQNPGPQGTVVGLDPKGDPVTGTLDARLANFLVGPQYATDGTQLVDNGADATDPNGPPLTFTPYINELQPSAWRQSGARIGKWTFYSGMTTDLDNDWAVFRYADILLVQAEATARLNSNWNDPLVLALVNQIRTRAGVTPYATITSDTFLAERGREMFCELFRRQDLIRFGKYNSAWRFHNADPDTHVNIFPIPATQITANPKLTQNPGY